MSEDFDDKCIGIKRNCMSRQKHLFEMSAYHWLNGRVESPIEEVFGWALLSYVFGYRFFWNVVDTAPDLGGIRKIMGDASTECSGAIYGIFCQVPIGPYRADFVAAYKLNDRAYYAVVECDGHDFHEKTKEQASRDKGRDRVIQAEGVLVLRFTGSELWRDAEKCAEQVFSTLMNIAYRDQESRS